MKIYEVIDFRSAEGAVTHCVINNVVLAASFHLKWHAKADPAVSLADGHELVAYRHA